MRSIFTLAFLGATSLLTSATVTQPTPYFMADFNTEATMKDATIGKPVKLVNSWIDDDQIEHEVDPVKFIADGKGVTPEDGFVLVPTGAYIQADLSDLPGFVNPEDPENPYVGTYTFVWDIKIPALGTYYCLLQTNPWNSTDAKICINNKGKLGSGFLGGYDSEWTAVPETWYRIAFTAHRADGAYALYVDGQCVDAGTSGNVEKIDGRYAMEKEGTLFFADENGEDAEIYCSKVMFFDRDLTPEEVASLGDPKTEIKTSGVADITSDNNVNINVASDSVNVNVAEGVAEVEVYNVTGIKVAGAAVSGTYTWNYADTVPGVYVVAVKHNGKTVNKKVIVK